MSRCIITTLFFFLYSSTVFSATNPDIQPTKEKGATVFKQRCTLCHGRIGMGEGLLAMAIKNYPNTNLLEHKIAVDDMSLRNVIIWGKAKGHATSYSPPWGNELTWTQIESVFLFVKYLRSETESAIKLLDKQNSNTSPSLKIGASIYNGRCARCHGSTGKGDGEMAKIINDPAPFNLTKSAMPDAYLRMIISRGGAYMQRSPQMPPWESELTSTELESVILYIKKFREQLRVKLNKQNN
ncbi:MAG: c-type cytochrome [Gammaproteobacteria bacterium]|nr:c-type cytochrome [Gammaproteobacteria bacterium]